MKRFVMSLALTCALSVQALAVDIPTVGVAQPIVTQATSIKATVVLAIVSLIRR